MNRTQVADAYASQSKPEARASALYFEGKIAFSYGEHFPLAIITGPKAATVNADTYSNTTGRHKGMIRRALLAEGFTLSETDTTTIRTMVMDARRAEHEAWMAAQNAETIARRA